MENRRKIGTNYERLAGKYLEAHGYQIIEYNFKCNAGEIDIIAKDREYLVFCEVKYRKTAKQRRISKCAQYYVYKNQWHEMPCRFDVVGILGTEVQLLKNAFDFVE